MKENNEKIIDFMKKEIISWKIIENMRKCEEKIKLKNPKSVSFEKNKLIYDLRRVYVLSL